MTFIPKLGRSSGYLVLKEGAARSLRNTQRFTEMAHHTGPWGFCLHQIPVQGLSLWLKVGTDGCRDHTGCGRGVCRYLNKAPGGSTLPNTG